MGLQTETIAGDVISFSSAAYRDAMERYTIKDIEAVVERIERRRTWQRLGDRLPDTVREFFEHFVPQVDPVDMDVANFFRDFAAIQAADHPDFDRGFGIGSLATRIEIATGQVPQEQLPGVLERLEAARVDYDLVFG